MKDQTRVKTYTEQFYNNDSLLYLNCTKSNLKHLRTLHLKLILALIV